jgi:hypothetical protein
MYGCILVFYNLDEFEWMDEWMGAFSSKFDSEIK